MTSIPFVKLHGLGNDFVIVDCLKAPPPPALQDASVIQHICNRKTGVGADGVIVALPARDSASQARMRIVNADGSEPQMCGNGIRCLARYLREHCLPLRQATSLHIETLAGLRRCDLQFDAASRLSAVRVDMGQPSLDRETLPMRGQGPFVDQPLSIGDTALTATAVSMGNPHLISFIDDDRDLQALARDLGPAVEHHTDFPERTNVEFARVGPDQRIELWVWERGCGITQACGTGACATAVAAVATKRCGAGKPLDVVLPGGTLAIEVDTELSRVWMTGPATEVFTGQISL